MGQGQGSLMPPGTEGPWDCGSHHLGGPRLQFTVAAHHTHSKPAPDLSLQPSPDHGQPMLSPPYLGAVTSWPSHPLSPEPLQGLPSPSVPPPRLLAPPWVSSLTSPGRGPWGHSERQCTQCSLQGAAPGLLFFVTHSRPHPAATLD